MYCKREKRDNLKKRDQRVLKNQVNSDSNRQELLGKNSKNSNKVHEGESSCSNRPLRYREKILNNNKMDYSLNQENVCRSFLINISKNKKNSSLESVELLNSDEKLN